MEMCRQGWFGIGNGCKKPGLRFRGFIGRVHLWQFATYWSVVARMLGQ